jgi:hypothetical protein
VRLQLILAVTTIATFARAQQLAKVDERAAVYQDTDHTTVVTNNVAARATPGKHAEIDARYLIDVISSASVDVISAATTRFNEARHEVEGGAEYHDDDRKLNASYIYSTENDWTSHTGNLGFTQDFAHHQVTLHLGGTAVSNDVGRSGDENFHRSLWVGGGSAGLTFVLTPRDLLDVAYTLAYSSGYQASPYRYVAFTGSVGPIALGAPENVPDTRARHAVTLRWNHHAFRSSAFRSHVRGYWDDWGVTSITAGTELVTTFGPAWELGAFVRGYAQAHAWFYEPTYPTVETYMTADRELSSFVDGFAGLRLGWHRERANATFTDLRADFRASGFAFEFFDFPRLPQRYGLLAEAAFGVTF